MTAKFQYGKDLPKVKLNVHLLKYFCAKIPVSTIVILP